MAAVALSAPLLESNRLVKNATFQDFLQNSQILIGKILESIPDTHKSCIYTETLPLNSAATARLETIVSSIGIPSAPVLKNISENFTLENSLSRMYEGLQLHQDLLTSVSDRLEKKNDVSNLIVDIRDLSLQINQMLQMARKEVVIQHTQTKVPLRLPGDYEVQVAAHWILVQLQNFGQDMSRCLRSLERSSEEDTET